jgi:hypothetical protein
VKFWAVIEGLQIFAKYTDRGLDDFLEANHDIIWSIAAEVDEDAEPTLNEDGDEILVDKRISDEDQARLRELGWFIDDGESWAAYC